MALSPNLAHAVATAKLGIPPGLHLDTLWHLLRAWGSCR